MLVEGTSTPVNLIPCGTQLQNFCNEKSVYKQIFNVRGCGWLDGGCLTLALALRFWLPVGTTVCAVVTGGIADHAVIRIPSALTHASLRDVFLDADGVASEADMLRKFKSYAQKDRGILRGLESRDELYVNVAVAQTLECRLKVALGDSRVWLQALTDQLRRVYECRHLPNKI